MQQTAQRCCQDAETQQYLADDGSAVTCGADTILVPETRRPYLVAHKLVRTFDSAGGDDPAFLTRYGKAATVTWITRAAKVAEVECALRLAKPRAERRPTGWGLGRLARVIRNGPASLSAEEVASIAAALVRVLLPTAPARRPTSAPVPEPTTSAHSAGPRIPDGAGTAAGATPARTGTATGPGTPTHTGPTCRSGAQMVMRRRRRDGAPFYGCSTFPACRQTKPI